MISILAWDVTEASRSVGCELAKEARTVISAGSMSLVDPCGENRLDMFGGLVERVLQSPTYERQGLGGGRELVTACIANRSLGFVTLPYTHPKHGHHVAIVTFWEYALVKDEVFVVDVRSFARPEFLQ